MEQTPRAFFQTTFEPIDRVCASRHARGGLRSQEKWRTRACVPHTHYIRTTACYMRATACYACYTVANQFQTTLKVGWVVKPNVFKQLGGLCWVMTQSTLSILFKGRNFMTKARFYRVKNIDANGNVVDDAIVPAQSKAEVEDNCHILRCRTEIVHLGFHDVQLQTNEDLGSTYNAKEETEYRVYIENHGEVSFSRDSVRDNSDPDSADIQRFAVRELEKKCAKDLKANQAKLDDIKKEDPRF